MQERQGQSQEERFRRKLAQWLGISYEELEEYAEDVMENDGSGGNLNYAYMLPFSTETPLEILRKLIRISRRYVVYFNLEELE